MIELNEREGCQRPFAWRRRSAGVSVARWAAGAGMVAAVLTVPGAAVAAESDVVMLSGSVGVVPGTGVGIGFVSGPGDMVGTISPYGGTGVPWSTAQLELVLGAVDDVPVVATWATVTAGDGHTCGIRAEGSLWCWGDNDRGRLGIGTADNVVTPVPTRVSDHTTWMTVEASRHHTCAIRLDGSLWCWGANDRGRVGDGTTLDRRVPVRVGSGALWAAVTAGDNHTCAIRLDGSLWCWGANDHGRVGDGTTLDRRSPVRVGDETSWVSVSAGEDHTCGTRADGTLWCWGRGTDGQLGDGRMTSAAEAAPTPVRIGEDTSWVSVVAGDRYTCAGQTSGSLWCWGDNRAGQLGDGTALRRPLPVLSGESTVWASVAPAEQHTCAVRFDGGLWCWGENGDGRLGDGTTTDRLAPVRVVRDGVWLTVSAADDHTCGIRVDGTLWCWGNGDDGALGNGTLGDSVAPVPVLTHDAIALLVGDDISLVTPLRLG